MGPARRLRSSRSSPRSCLGSRTFDQHGGGRLDMDESARECDLVAVSRQGLRDRPRGKSWRSCRISNGWCQVAGGIADTLVAGRAEAPEIWRALFRAHRRRRRANRNACRGKKTLRSQRVTLQHRDREGKCAPPGRQRSRTMGTPAIRRDINRRKLMENGLSSPSLITRNSAPSRSITCPQGANAAFVNGFDDETVWSRRRPAECAKARDAAVGMHVEPDMSDRPRARPAPPRSKKMDMVGLGVLRTHQIGPKTSTGRRWPRRCPVPYGPPAARPCRGSLPLKWAVSTSIRAISPGTPRAITIQSWPGSRRRRVFPAIAHIAPPGPL